MFFSSLYTQPNEDTQHNTTLTNNTQATSYFSLGFTSAFGDVLGPIRRGWRLNRSVDEAAETQSYEDNSDDNPADPALLASKIHNLILNSPLLDSSNPLSPLAASGYTPLPPEHSTTHEFSSESSSSAPQVAIGTFQPPQAFNFPVSPPASHSTSLPYSPSKPEGDARLLAVLSSPLVMNGDLSTGPSSWQVLGGFIEQDPSPGSSVSEDPISPSHRTRKMSVFDVLDSIPSPFASPPPESPLSLSASGLPYELRGISSPLVSPERDQFMGWGSFADMGSSSGPRSGVEGEGSQSDEAALELDLPDEGSSFMLYSPLVPTPNSMVEIAESGVVEEDGGQVSANEIPTSQMPTRETSRWYWPFGTSAASTPASAAVTATTATNVHSTTSTPAPAYSRHPLPTPPRVPAARRRPRVWVPSKTQLSIQALWWGYRIYLPPPVMAALTSHRSPLQSFSHQATVLTTALTWFLSNLPLSVLPIQVRPIVALLQLLVPYVGYVGGFIGWSWGQVKGYDEGHGVILTATWLLPVALIPSTWYQTDFPPASPAPSPLYQHRPLPSIAAVLSGAAAGELMTSGDNTEENARLLGSPPPNYRTEPTTPVMYASPPPIHTSIHPMESAAAAAAAAASGYYQETGFSAGVNGVWSPVNGTSMYLSPSGYISPVSTSASSPLAESVYGSPTGTVFGPFSPMHVPMSPMMLNPVSLGHGPMFSSPPPPSPLLRLSPLPSSQVHHLSGPGPDTDVGLGGMNPWTLATPVVARSASSPHRASTVPSASTSTSKFAASLHVQPPQSPPPPPHSAYASHPGPFSPPPSNAYNTYSPTPFPMVDPYAYMATPSTVFGADTPSPAILQSPHHHHHHHDLHPHLLSPIQEHARSPVWSPGGGMPGGMPGTPVHPSPPTATTLAPSSPSQGYGAAVAVGTSTIGSGSVYGTPVQCPEYAQLQGQAGVFSPFVNQGVQVQGVWGCGGGGDSPWAEWGVRSGGAAKGGRAGGCLAESASASAGGGGGGGGEATPPPPPSGRREVELPVGEEGEGRRRGSSLGTSQGLGSSYTTVAKIGSKSTNVRVDGGEKVKSRSRGEAQETSGSRREDKERRARRRETGDAVPSTKTKVSSTKERTRTGKSRSLGGNDVSSGMVVIGTSTSASPTGSTSMARSSPHKMSSWSQTATAPVVLGGSTAAGGNVMTTKNGAESGSTESADGGSVKRSKSKLAGSIGGMTERFGRVLSFPAQVVERRRERSRGRERSERS